MPKAAQKEIRSQKRKVLEAPIQNLGVVMTMVVFFLIIFGCGDEPSSDNTKSIEYRTEPSFKGTIVAVGDSLTAGLGLDESQAYPALLEKTLISDGYPFKVINAGFSCETTRWTLSSIHWVLPT